LDSFQKTNKILEQMTSITSPKLSLNQESIMSSSYIEIKLKKNKLTDLANNSKIKDAVIQIPSICDKLYSDCSQTIVTSQVILNMKFIIKNKI
jgi:hypothetical protein